MTTNREWLYSLDVADLADWFDAEHAEQNERDELEAFAKRLERAAHDKLGVTLFGVDYVTEEFMLHVRDTLTAERDEWKAKAENILNAESYKFASEPDAESYIDCGKVENDSREKLEADARALQTRIWRAGANSDGVSLTHIIELLDRQAEITEHELCKQCDWPSLAAQPDYESQGRIVALTDKVDELTAERDALADDLLTCNKEREEYRELFSKSLTLAAEIVNLQP